MTLDKLLLENFVCQMCGNCCEVEGIVRVTIEESAAIAGFLGISPGELRERYLRRHAGRGWITRNQPGTTKCIFLTPDRKCGIQPVKPRQCRDFPVKWRNDDAESYCAGIQLLLQQQAERDAS